jgi:hypothetical protein
LPSVKITIPLNHQLKTMQNRNNIITAILFALACFVLLPKLQAVSPAPDGGYANFNTAEGTDALFSLTTGVGNTAVGRNALHNDTTGQSNTASGYNALYFNTGSFNTADGRGALYRNSTGNYNTATGYQALNSNTRGTSNTAHGFGALATNTQGSDNTAEGAAALASNTTGPYNTAVGYAALGRNTIGGANTAIGWKSLQSNIGGSADTGIGYQALFSNTSGHDNVASGYQTLYFNTTGYQNTADGDAALSLNTTGNNNIALGYGAGGSLTTGSNNIDIGNLGNREEGNTIRIGTEGTQTATYIAGISGATASGGAAVFVNANGKLGTMTSSARFKDEIKPMDKASDTLFSLKPVTFRYKKEIDPQRIAQFGLVAEEVEKVNPDLVIRDAKGRPQTVRYEQINAMLLNEFLKEHKAFLEEQRRAQKQEATIARLKSDAAKEEATISQLKNGMGVLTAQLKEQAAQIQKVSGRLDLQQPALRTVVENR